MRPPSAEVGAPAPVAPRQAPIPFLPYIAISLVHCVLIIFGLPGSGFETKQPYRLTA